MTATELKCRTHLQDWSAMLQACRSNGLSVRKWCQENRIAVSTYYRLERAALPKTERATKQLKRIVFAELPALQPMGTCWNIAPHCGLVMPALRFIRK